MDDILIINEGMAWQSAHLCSLPRVGYGIARPHALLDQGMIQRLYHTSCIMFVTVLDSLPGVPSPCIMIKRHAFGLSCHSPMIFVIEHEFPELFHECTDIHN